MDTAPWYANLVGRSWYYSNRALKLYDAAKDICEGEFNVSAVPELVSSATSKTAPDAANALHYANESVSKLVGKAGAIADEMYRGGVTYVPYADLRSVYSTAVDAVRAYEGNTPSTALGVAISRYKDTHPAIRTVFTAAGVEVPRVLVYVGKFGRVIAPNLSREILAGVSTVFQGIFSKLDPGDVVNSAVGTRDSVYSEAVRFLDEYYAVVNGYDRSAQGILEDARRTYDAVVKLSSDVEYRSSQLSPEMLSFFSSDRGLEVSVADEPSSLPADARIRAAKLKKFIEGNVYAYIRRENNYLVAYWRAERAFKELAKVKGDLERYSNEISALAESCYKTVSKYRPRSGYLKSVLPGYAAALKENPDFSLCVQALQLMALDANYARDEAILASCESAVSCGSVLPEDYPCVGGEIGDRIDCCLRYRERKHSEILSSELYSQYLQLRRSVEALLSIYDDPSLRSEHLANPVDFICDSDLAKAISRETKIYLKLRKAAEGMVKPEVLVDGYLNAKTVSSVRVRFLLDAGGADLLVNYDLPFQVLAYRVVESNGLWISISANGRTASLRGSGSVLIDAEVMPVELEVEEWGASMGHKYLRVRNRLPIPVKYPFSGDVVSASDNVSYDGKYVYFDGVGEVLLAVPAVEVNYVIHGDTATVSIRNASEYEYKGEVVIPLSGRKLPRGCKPLGDVSVCSVNLDPFSEDVIEIEGVSSDLNFAFEESVSSFSTVSEFGSSKLYETAVLSDTSGTVNDMRDKIFRRLEELQKLFERAEELNVVNLLPYSSEFLDSMNSRISETNDSVVLAVYESVLNSIYNDVVSRARALVFSVPPDTDVRALAERALNSGDYMLAMALAASYHPKRAPGTSVPYASLALGVLSLGLLVYYLRTQKPKKRRRIPKI